MFKYKISQKSVQLELRFTMQTDRRTEEQNNVKNIVVAFRKFCEFAEKYSHLNGRIYSIVTG